jgi:hypothetical protein
VQITSAASRFRKAAVGQSGVADSAIRCWQIPAGGGKFNPKPQLLSIAFNSNPNFFRLWRIENFPAAPTSVPPFHRSSDSIPIPISIDCRYCHSVFTKTIQPLPYHFD